MSYARSAVTRMTLDMSRPDLQRSETVTLGDTNRRWEVTLINGGAPFRLPPNWTAALTGIKPDGNGLLNGCSVVDGKIIYDFAAGKEIATCVGGYPVQFDIWDEVGELVASPKVYVSVLADVRPREGMKSESEYGLLGKFIEQKNDLIDDITNNTTHITNNTTQIAALKEKVTTAGTITIPVSEWEDGSPTIALFTLDGFGKGMYALLMPADINTQTAAREARLSAFPDVSQIDDDTQTVEIIRANADKAPDIPLRFAYLILKTADTSVDPSVAIIGVDAYGETEEPTSVDLSGFSPNENGKGSIVETYADRTVVTELTYDDTGRIIKIGDTTLEWGEEE